MEAKSSVASLVAHVVAAAVTAVAEIAAAVAAVDNEEEEGRVDIDYEAEVTASCAEEAVRWFPSWGTHTGRVHYALAQCSS